LNQSVISFFHGQLYELEDAARNETYGLLNETVAELGAMRRRLLAMSTDKTYSETLFSLSGTRMYSDSGFSVTCNSCSLTGSLRVTATLDAANSYFTAQATGTLSLRMQLALQFANSYSSGERTTAIITPQCSWPLCWSKSILGLGDISVGVRVGLFFVGSYASQTTATITIDSSTSLVTTVSASYVGTPTYGFSMTTSNAQTLSAPPSIRLSVDALLGLKPVVQVRALSVGLRALQVLANKQHSPFAGRRMGRSKPGACARNGGSLRGGRRGGVRRLPRRDSEQ
jgi:hypothetical protein